MSSIKDIKEGDVILCRVSSLILSDVIDMSPYIDDRSKIFIFLGFEIRNIKDTDGFRSLVFSKILCDDQIKFWLTYTKWNEKIETITKDIYKQLQTNLKNFFKIVE